MKHVIPSNKTIYEEAKSAVNRADKAWRRAHNAYLSLYLPRLRLKSEITEAEVVARRACDAVGESLRAAREHLNYVIATVPKSKSCGVRKEDNGDVDDD